MLADLRAIVETGLQLPVSLSQLELRRMIGIGRYRPWYSATWTSTGLLPPAGLQDSTPGTLDKPNFTRSLEDRSRAGCREDQARIAEDLLSDGGSRNAIMCIGGAFWFLQDPESMSGM